MPMNAPNLAVITGASSGIGLEMGRWCAEEHYAVIVAADDPVIFNVAEDLAAVGASITAVQCDLSSAVGIEKLRAVVDQEQRPVEVLIAAAAQRSGHAFLDQSIDEALKVVHTQIDATIQLVHGFGQSMRARGRGRILIAGSMAGLLPGAYQAICSASEAFLESFSLTLKEELKNSGVSVSCLMPAVTKASFFESLGGLSSRADVDGAVPSRDIVITACETMNRSSMALFSESRFNRSRPAVMPSARSIALQSREFAVPAPLCP
jgi:uncharacterized protein